MDVFTGMTFSNLVMFAIIVAPPRPCTLTAGEPAFKAPPSRAGAQALRRPVCQRSAYLTVSEIFPMETRALAIAFFYALGTAAGGISGPLLFGVLIASGNAQSWPSATSSARP